MSDKKPLGLDCDVCMEKFDGWENSDMEFLGFEVHGGDAIYQCPRCERVEGITE